MRSIVFYVAVYLLFSGVIVHAQSLDQKKTELKKIYEAGGISKIEFEKSKEFLLKSDEIIKEKVGGAHRYANYQFQTVKEKILSNIILY